MQNELMQHRQQYRICRVGPKTFRGCIQIVILTYLECDDHDYLFRLIHVSYCVASGAFWRLVPGESGAESTTSSTLHTARAVSFG